MSDHPSDAPVPHVDPADVDPAEPPLPGADLARPRSNRLFSPGSFLESSRIASVLRAETAGGLLLIAGAAIAIVWANTPWADTYEAIRDYEIGPASLNLDLSLGKWAADGLLAIFFFVVGLELKREFVAGDLRDPRRAALPMVAAAMRGDAWFDGPGWTQDAAARPGVQRRVG